MVLGCKSMFDFSKWED